MKLTVSLPTSGLPHQVKDLDENGDKEEWGRLWEMGVGKTWPTLVEAAQLFVDNRIDVLVIVAPKAVAVNWVIDQVPRHLPLDVNAYCVAYDIPKSRTQEHRARVEVLRRHWRERRGLAVLAVSYEGVMDDTCKELLKELLGAQRLPDKTWRGSGRSMIVADESSYIGNNDSQRTQRSYTLGECAGYRRILEGTPVTNNPQNVYSQMKFLRMNYWDRYGIHSYKAFTAAFCKIRKHKNLTVKTRGGREVMVPKIVGYQNLEQLKKMLLAGASRLTTEEAGIHLPPQNYQRLRFAMHPTQRKVYDQLRREFMVELDGGHFMAAPLAMVRLLRLQQVTSGFLPFEDERGDVEVVPIVPEDENPRLELLMEHLGLVPHQAIIFARFTAEIDMICRHIPRLKEQCVRFDGTVSTKDRERALAEFTSGGAKFLVGHIRAAGRGLTLVNAKRTIYYSNDFNYGDRAQSEKRIHRIGQHDPCWYDDLEAIGTVDGKIIKSLRAKHELASMITGDVLRQWLAE